MLRNRIRLFRRLARVLVALLPGALAGQTAAPPVPLWPSDNRPPRNLQGNYVFLDQTASAIVVVIPGSLEGQPDRPAQIIRVPLHNRFDPEVTVSISRVEPSGYRYLYSLANGRAATDPVKGWIVAASCNDPRSSIEAHPSGWRCIRIDDRFASVRQFALPYLSPGCALICFLDGQQPPDSPSDQFAVVSGLKPGLTTASAGNDPPFQASRDWPEVILEQLATLGNPAWSSRHIVTLGPRFGTDVSAAAIATDFLRGLAELVRTGRLASDSDFLRQLRAALAQAAQTGRVDATLIVNPSTELEREIAEAVKLSLGSG